MCPDTYGLKDQGGVLRHASAGLCVLKGGDLTIVRQGRRVGCNSVNSAGTEQSVDEVEDLEIIGG